MKLPLPRAVLAVVLSLAAMPALAGPAASLPVDEKALPAGARSAWLDVLLLAPVAEHWTDKWRWPEPRDEVAAVLARSLKALEAETAKAPGNLDLLLATGIAARFAHNVDVPGAPELGFQVLERAAVAAPKDPRPRWQLGANYCEVGEFVKAMRNLATALELWGASRPPAAFWQTDMRCSHAANMPAHVLRAARELRRDGPLSSLQETMAEGARELLVQTTPDSKFAPTEAFRSQKVGDSERLVSWPCGFAVQPLSLDRVKVSPVQSGTCVVQMDVGPFPGKTGDVWPSVGVAARVAGEGETLQDFLGRFEFLKTGQSVAVEVCPVGSCLGVSAPTPKSYAHEGGGIAFATVFEAKEPAFPSLLLEQPTMPPGADDGQVHYYRPTPRPMRFRGRIFYLVLLDTARSVEPKARAEYRRFLGSMVVE